jgi:N-acetylmuramoyl-L-alanine amidase
LLVFTGFIPAGVGCVMRVRRFAWVFLLMTAALLWAAGGAADARQSRVSGQDIAADATVVTQITIQDDAEGAFVVIDMSRKTRASISVMTSPNRLLLDLPAARFHAPAIRTNRHGPHIKEARFGAFMRGQGRIVLELATPSHVDEQRFLPLEGGGHRLVVALKQISSDAFTSLAKPLSDDIITGTTPKSSTQELPLVVLDPGHGGIDPGASGPGGELEKTIVLQFALALKQRLERDNKARVVMTRTGDVFVPLKDRVRIARQAKAQLFISLHADALPDEGDVRGASVYTLSERATDDRSQKLAERENTADAAAGLDTTDTQDDVSDILFDLARRESRAFSVQFARGLVSTLPKATRMHKTPLRGAAFRVLRAPDVPSVLVELGYLTTAEEAKMMSTDEWRKATADAMAEAIERFLADRVQRGREGQN